MRLFVSYSRLDRPAVRLVVNRLEDCHDVWIDWEDIPAAHRWATAIERGIEQADAFVFLLSPTSCLSDYCLKELEYASSLNKLLVPVLLTDVGNQCPAALGQYQWLSLKDFEIGIKDLLQTLERSAGDATIHTNLLISAKTWQRSGKKEKFLLQGGKLGEAIAWLEATDDRQPVPLQIQREFILQSQLVQLERRSKDNRALLVLMAVALPFVLSIFFEFAIEADREGISKGSIHSRADVPDRVQAITAILGVGGLAGISRGKLAEILKTLLKAE